MATHYTFKRFIPCSTEFKDSNGYIREMDSFQITEVSGKRVYLTAIKDGIRLTAIAKNITIKENTVNIKFGNKLVQIGTITKS